MSNDLITNEALGKTIIEQKAEIAQLKALLNLSEAKHDRLVDENAGLEAQIHNVKNELLSIIIPVTPKITGYTSLSCSEAVAAYKIQSLVNRMRQN